MTAGDLAAAGRDQQVQVGPGDLVFIRVGHRLRRFQLGPWDAAGARAGLHPAVMEYLAGRKIALLGSDGNNDTAPSAVPGVDFPVHVLAIAAVAPRASTQAAADELPARITGRSVGGAVLLAGLAGRVCVPFALGP